MTAADLRHGNTRLFAFLHHQPLLLIAEGTFRPPPALSSGICAACN
jgi:hypothetical protein